MNTPRCDVRSDVKSTNKPIRFRKPTTPRPHRLALPSGKTLATLMTALAALITALAHLLR